MTDPKRIGDKLIRHGLMYRMGAAGFKHSFEITDEMRDRWNREAEQVQVLWAQLNTARMETFEPEVPLEPVPLGETWYPIASAPTKTPIWVRHVHKGRWNETVAECVDARTRYNTDRQPVWMACTWRSLVTGQRVTTHLYRLKGTAVAWRLLGDDDGREPGSAAR